MSTNRVWIGAGILSLAVAACSEPNVTPFEAPLASRPPSPIECPTSATQTTTSVIGPAGGVLSLGGTVVSIPLGAVLEPTTLTVTIPASNHMEIDVSAAGVEHFLFEAPVVVTIDYSRCTRNNINLRPLSVWYFDPSTDELLENMGGVDDKLNKRMIFTTPHLSGYVIAD